MNTTAKAAYALVAAGSLLMAGVQATDHNGIAVEASATAVVDHALSLAFAEPARPAPARKN